MANLAQLLTDQAAKQPEHPAILAGDRVVSYAEFDDAAARVAAFLFSQGFQAGDRAGVMLANTPEFCIVCYGVLRAGGTVVPMNPLLKSREVEYYLSDSGAGLLFAAADSPGEPAPGAAAAGARFVPAGAADLAALLQAQLPAPGVADRADDDTALILYTSGTTGQPKGAELSHANLRTNAQLSAETLFSLSPSDVVMGCLPLFHVFGLTCGLNTAVELRRHAGPAGPVRPGPGAGDHPALPGHRVRGRADHVRGAAAPPGPGPVRPQLTADLCQRRRGPPGGTAPLVRGRVRHDDPGGLRAVRDVSGGRVQPPGPGAQAGLDRHPGARRAASPGHPGRHRRAGRRGGRDRGPRAERDEGLLGRPEATKETIPDGWLRTGDLARQDEDGYFFIVDRKKDLVIRGGFNVYPREIEEVLYEHPAVAEAAVIGIPHPTLGEEIGAAAALKPGASATPDELRAFVKARVAAYKYPRHVWLVDALPKGATGKILRREVSPPEGLVP